MRRDEAFGVLRQLLSQLNEERSFEAILELIESWPDPEERDQVFMPYLMGELRRWFHGRRSTPSRWLEALSGQEPPAYMALASQLLLRPGEAAAHLDRLTRSPARAWWRALDLREASVSAEQLLRLAQPGPLESLELQWSATRPEVLLALEALVERGHLQELFLTGMGVDDALAQRLADWPGLSSLQTLELSQGDLTERGLQALASSPHLASVRNLYLRATSLGAGAVELIGQGPWASLERLDLERARLGGASWQALGRLTSLRRLDVASCGLRGPDLDALRQAGVLGRLSELVLSSNPDLRGHMQALAQASPLPRLEVLHMYGCELSDEDAAILPVGGLAYLSVGQGGMGPRGVEALIQRLDPERLEELSLWGQQLDEQALQALVARPWPKLRQLNLNQVQLGPWAAPLLGRASMPALQQLSLYKAMLGEPAPAVEPTPDEAPEPQAPRGRKGRKGRGASPGMRALGAWGGAPALKHLELSSNALDDSALAALGAGPLLRSVESIVLVENRFTDAALARLITRALPQLRRFERWSAPLGPKAAYALASEAVAPRLEHLDVSWGRLPVASVEALAAGRFERLEHLDLNATWLSTALAAKLGAAHMPKLRTLVLAEAHLGPEGLRQWLDAGASGWVHLSDVALGARGLLDEGVEALVERAQWEGLHHLGLWANQIGPRGASALGQWPALRGLYKLNLNRNPIGEDGLALILDSPWLQGLHALSIRGTRVGQAGVAALRQRRPERWVELELSDLALPEAALIGLAQDEALISLRTLRAGAQTWTMMALGELGRGPLQRRLTTLQLQQVGLTAQGVEALLPEGSWPRQQELALQDNPLGAAGVRALVRAHQRSHACACLQVLRLSGCQLDDEAAGLLADWPGARQLSTLELDRNPSISAQGRAKLASSPHLRAILRASWRS